MITNEQVLEALASVYDPEIPVNIVDLGLIYGIEVSPEDKVHIKMTLTAPGCPMHVMISQSAKDAVTEKTGAKEVEVEMVWEPRWTPDRISEDGKKKLNF